MRIKADIRRRNKLWVRLSSLIIRVNAIAHRTLMAGDGPKPPEASLVRATGVRPNSAALRSITG
jgi:hypothetical protein